MSLSVNKRLTLIITAKSTSRDDVEQSYESWWKLNTKISFLNSKLTYLTAYTTRISKVAYLKHYPSKIELPIVPPLFQSCTYYDLHLTVFSNTDIIRNSSLSLHPKSNSTVKPLDPVFDMSGIWCLHCYNHDLKLHHVLPRVLK